MDEWTQGALLGILGAIGAVLLTWYTIDRAVGRGPPLVPFDLAIQPTITNNQDNEDGEDEEVYKCGWLYLRSHLECPVQYNPANLLSVMKRSGSYGPEGSEGIFFAVIQDGCILSLYESEEQSDTLGDILLRECTVELVDGQTGECDVFLDEMYSRDTPIRLSSKTDGAVWRGTERQVFLWFPTGYDKEDWLSALRQATDNKSPKKRQLLKKSYSFGGFEESHAAIQRNAGDEATAALFNGLIARILPQALTAPWVKRFMAVGFGRKQATQWRPSVLSPLTLLNLDLSRVKPPLIKNGVLHALTKEGELIGSVDICFPGTVILEATCQISLNTPSPSNNNGGSRASKDGNAEASKPFSSWFPSLVIPVHLRVTCKSLSGRAHLRIKSPPSDRIWMGFYEMPLLQLDIQPTVHSTAVNIAWVKSLLAKQLETSLRETLVLPAMEQLAVIGQWHCVNEGGQDVILTEMPTTNTINDDGGNAFPAQTPSDLLTAFWEGDRRIFGQPLQQQCPLKRSLSACELRAKISLIHKCITNDGADGDKTVNGELNSSSFSEQLVQDKLRLGRRRQSSLQPLKPLLDSNSSNVQPQNTGNVATNLMSSVGGALKRSVSKRIAKIMASVNTRIDPKKIKCNVAVETTITDESVASFTPAQSSRKHSFSMHSA